jgi:hypothetical protein
VTADDNDLNGIQINNANTVTLNNVIADDSGTNPPGPNNSVGSGVLVNGTGSTIVNVTGGTFTDNERYGIEVLNGTINIISNPSFGGNGLGNIYPDSTPPVITHTITCLSFLPVIGGWCRGTVLVDWTITDPESFVTSTTGCGPAPYFTFVTTDTPFTGLTLTCSATTNGGTSSATATVFRDFTQPNLALPANIMVEATGPGGATVNYSATASDGVDPSVTPICAPSSGSTFAIGATPVNCTATDDAGNTRTGNFTVTVQDTTPPALTLPANMTIEATSPSGAVANFVATANDIVDGARPVTCVDPSGSTFPIALPGPTTTVNCSASDTRGNIANGGFTVTVQDTTPPTLTLPADLTLEATGPAGAVATFSASANDIVDGARPVTCVLPSGSTFPITLPITTTTVNCSASDTRGNTANGSFGVTVQDTTPPVISPMTNIIVNTLNDIGKHVNYIPPATSDIVDGAGVATCDPPPGSLFAPEDTTVTCTATDSHGNTSSITFNVHVHYRPASVLSVFGLGGIILVTGGELIDLDCFTTANAFGILVTFYNLCEQQAIMDEVNENTLPSALPNGYKFIKGINVDILGNGQLLDTLPSNAGVQMDFPLPGGSDFAVLYWNDGEWVEISQLMNDAELDKMLSTDAGNELYKLSSSNAGVNKVLTTELTGTFVLVQK